MTNTSHPNALSVSELNRQARQLLERSFLTLHIEGEISNFACPSSGHWYFTLKDDRAQVRCAMFKNRNQLIRPLPSNGDKVIVRAKVSLYEGRGDYQLICDFMQPAGAGSLQAAYEETKQKLKQEGLFETSNKQPLPEHPTQVGLITSATGAALHDILTVLKRRYPGLPVIIYPSAVQGDDAVPQLCKALLLAQADNSCDVLIIGRGGGSLEDLWAFNNEQLAREVFNCHIPIISAVGHEVDTVITDFVADIRAPTPSAAAELISPDQQQLKTRLNLLNRRIHQQMQLRLNNHKQALNVLQAKLKHPGDKLKEQYQTLDHLELRLNAAMRTHLITAKQTTTALESKVKLYSPATMLSQKKERIEALKHRLRNSFQFQLRKHKLKLQALATQLNTVSPLATLERGYAIVRDSQGHVLTDATTLAAGTEIETILHKGRIICSVKETAEK